MSPSFASFSAVFFPPAARFFGRFSAFFGGDSVFGAVFSYKNAGEKKVGLSYVNKMF
jgi:hypothetical protein